MKTPHPGYGQCSRHGGNTDNGIKWAARLRAEAEVQQARGTLTPPDDPRNPREVAGWILERDVERVAQIESTLRQSDLDMATRLVLMARSLAERREAGQLATTMHKNNLSEEYRRSELSEFFLFVIDRAYSVAEIELTRQQERRFARALESVARQYERETTVIDTSPIPLPAGPESTPN